MVAKIDNQHGVLLIVFLEASVIVHLPIHPHKLALAFISRDNEIALSMGCHADRHHVLAPDDEAMLTFGEE